MTASSRPVVVGVDGSKDNLGALRYGTEEARRAGVPLKLVHVVPDYVPISPMMPLTPEDLEQTGATVLTRSEEQAHALEPAVQVEGWLHHGTRPVELVRGAEDGRVLVVGRDNRPLVERILRGDAAAGVAARSTVPMVLVASDWEPGRERGVVVVGVKSPKHADALLGDAMELASATAAKLVVIHAWKAPSGYDDIIESRIVAQEWRQRAVNEVESLLANWRAAYPGVETEIRVVHDHAAHALVEASSEADVLVIVRRAHGVPAAAHLGATARAVLRTAHCPTRVVPPETEPATPKPAPQDAAALVMY